jgi:type III pantothenate kinase
MYLADIGNSRFHLYDGKEVLHLGIDEALRVYGTQRIYYISVNSRYKKEFQANSNWIDLAPYIKIPNEYEGMGIDRKALCSSRDDGVFVDAGSAITVDVMCDGVYEGGFILPGIRAYQKSFADISQVLDVEIDTNLDISKLPTTTKGQISYGIIASIKTLIDTHSKDLPLFMTGGDGSWLVGFFENATYDEKLVFEGMLNVIRNTKDLDI